MNFASLKYTSPSTNLGDTIQSIAAEQFIPRVDAYFDRDRLGEVRERYRHLLIMNGWFTQHPEYWPPSEAVLPVFFGFHLGNYQRVQKPLLAKRSIDYFKQFEPIGCRDRETEKMLAGKGIKTFYSKCLTLTFPKRVSEPIHGKVFLVDIHPDEIPLPRQIEAEGIKITHEVPSIYPDEIKFQMARFLLDLYKNDARLVITTKLHCALPCIAFGIPVIFFGDPGSYRLTILRDLGIDIHRPPTGEMQYRSHALRGAAELPAAAGHCFSFRAYHG